MHYRSLLKLLAFATAFAALLVAIRLLIIEPDAMAQNCVANPAALACKLRGISIYGFSRHLFMPISLVAVALGWIGGLRAFALAAVFAGMAGAILYDFELSAVGLLGGALLFARLDVKERENRERKQRAPQTPV